MFNVKAPDTRDCNGNVIYNGQASYIHSVQWDDFINDMSRYINIAVEINNNIEDYNVVKQSNGEGIWFQL